MKRPALGEVWLVDLGLTTKIRPCLVIAIPTDETERALVTLVPHTTLPRATQFEVSVEADFLRTGVFDAQGLITVPTKYAIHRLGSLNAPEIKLIEAAVRKWLRLSA